MSFLRRPAAVLAGVFLLLVSGCATTGNLDDSSQVESGPDATAIATTAPVAVPAATAIPPTPIPPTPIPPTPIPATAVPTAAAPAATEAPAPAAAQSEPAPATAVPATPVPVEPTALPPTATPVPAEPTATPTPATPTPSASTAGGAVVALGDFEVVNLVTGANQNIAELAPSGATMLWFWAPH